MSVPFDKFRVFHSNWNNHNRFTVEVSPSASLKGGEREFELDNQRRFIEEAIKEKLERERTRE